MCAHYGYIVRWGWACSKVKCLIFVWRNCFPSKFLSVSHSARLIIKKVQHYTSKYLRVITLWNPVLLKLTGVIVFVCVCVCVCMSHLIRVKIRRRKKNYLHKRISLHSLFVCCCCIFFLLFQIFWDWCAILILSMRIPTGQALSFHITIFVPHFVSFHFVLVLFIFFLLSRS